MQRKNPCIRVVRASLVQKMASGDVGALGTVQCGRRSLPEEAMSTAEPRAEPWVVP